ncbi:MAG: YceI family protein [Acidobacteriota bacterium]|nr:YceI family protein [Acidobacteriota bacterium]
MKHLTAILLALILVPAAAAAQQPGGAPPAQAPAAAASPNTWRVDSSHSSAGFSVRHMMVATVRGTLGPISGAVEYDGKDVSSIRADVTIDVTKINTGNERRDNDLRAADFFDVARHPTITFKSKRVQPGGEGRFSLVGDLTMRGVTKEVTLDVDGPSPAVKDPKGGLKIGATATTKLNRRDFGLNYNNLIEAGPVVGDEVTVTIDLELNKAAG